MSFSLVSDSGEPAFTFDKFPGLTKYEYAVIHIMAGLAANPELSALPVRSLHSMAEERVDALIGVFRKES